MNIKIFVEREKKAFTANTALLRGLKSFTEFKFVRSARILFCSHVLCIPLLTDESVDSQANTQKKYHKAKQIVQFSRAQLCICLTAPEKKIISSSPKVVREIKKLAH